MRILDRYLAGQLVVPFLIGVGTFAVILLGDEARKLGEMLSGSVSFGLIVRYLAYNAPQALAWSLPVGTLVGVAMAVTSQARAGETIAMRTGGISFARICLPFLAFAALATAMSFLLTEKVVPSAMRQAHEVFRQMTYSQPVVREEHNVFFRDEQGRIFYIRHMNASRNELQDITIWTLGGQGWPTTITAARRASLQGRRWTLHDGATVTLTADGRQMKKIERFASRQIVLWKALQDYYTEHRTPYEMSTSELERLVLRTEDPVAIQVLDPRGMPGLRPGGCSTGGPLCPSRRVHGDTDRGSGGVLVQRDTLLGVGIRDDGSAEPGAGCVGAEYHLRQLGSGSAVAA